MQTNNSKPPVSTESLPFSGRKHVRLEGHGSDGKAKVLDGFLLRAVTIGKPIELASEAMNKASPRVNRSSMNTSNVVSIEYNGADTLIHTESGSTYKIMDMPEQDVKPAGVFAHVREKIANFLASI